MAPRDVSWRDHHNNPRPLPGPKQTVGALAVRSLAPSVSVHRSGGFRPAANSLGTRYLVGAVR
jgi:hypothetical protein